MAKNKKAEVNRYFLKNKKAEVNRYFLKNKKADIPITLLVIAVVFLCTTALIVFNLTPRTVGVVKSAYLLQDTYNLADSIEYTGLAGFDKYNQELQDYQISYNENKNEFTIERTYYKHDLGVSWGEGDEVLKITYNSVLKNCNGGHV